MAFRIKKRKILHISFALLLIYNVQFYIDSVISFTQFSKKWIGLVRDGQSWSNARIEGLLAAKEAISRRSPIFVHAVSASTIVDHITTPTTGSVVGGTSVSITATAVSQSGATVDGIQYRLDGANLGAQATVANGLMAIVGNNITAIFPWNTTTTTDGVHSLTIITHTPQYGNGQVLSPAISVTVDNTAPVRSLGSPSTPQASGTTQTNITLTTNESATCKYSTSAGVAYASMTNTFATPNTTSHSQNITGLVDGGSYTYYVRCQDTIGNADATDYSISFSVLNETVPPVLSNGAPSGPLASGTTQTNITLTTNENSTCKYSTTAGQTYASMANTFTTTGGTSHSKNITGLVDGGSYTYYVRCQDTFSNANVGDYTISFTILNETVPPVLSNGAPSGPLVSGTTQTNITLTTNENSTCKYSTTAGQTYASMANTFTTTGGTSHSKNITGLVDGGSYTYYVRCQDTLSNVNTVDFPIIFSVMVPDFIAPSAQSSLTVL